jgi:hypothetical protein
MHRAKDIENIYYNIDIVSSKTESTATTADPVASFSETRDVAIIDNASKYKMAITRFTMNGIKDIPLFIPVIEAGQPNPNKTVYWITIEAYGLTSSQPVIYKPASASTTLKTGPFTKQSLGEEYYYIHTYQHMVNLVNDAIVNAVDDLKAQDGTAFQNYVAPVVVFNTDTRKFDWYIPTSNECKLFFNSNMYNLFSNYPHFYNSNAPHTQVYQIDTTKRPDTITSGQYYIVKQEAPSIGTFWSPVSSIVFTSSMLPIVAEGVAPPRIFGESNIATPTNSASNFEPIITDIALTLDDAYEYKQFVSYIPTSQYRYVSLTDNNQALKSINVNVYWKARMTGELIPLRMSNQSSISIKFLFERK